MERWAGDRTRYAWRPAFEQMPVPTRVAPIQFLNGERDYLLLPLDGAAARAERPVPEFLAFANQANGRSYQITFDAEETLGTFARAGVGGQVVDLVFAAGGPTGLRVLVRGRGAAAELRKVRVAMFGAT